MREIVCTQCGAVMVSSADVTICSHCSRDPRKPTWRQTILLASSYVGVALWLVVVASRLLPEKNDWEQDAVFCALLAAAGLTLLYIRRDSIFAKKTFADMNLTSYTVPAAAEEASWNTAKPPEVPAKWAGLIGTPRPREVYWPFASKVWTTSEVAFIVAISGYFVFTIHGNAVAFQHWAKAWENNLPFLVITLFADGLLFLEIYREIHNRQLLRDGEATIGTIIDLIPGRHGRSTVVYQFWTRGGERFEHRGRAVTRKEDFSAPGLVPVFYPPEGPSRSLALNCTNLRVRIPGDELAGRMERIGMKS